MRGVRFIPILLLACIAGCSPNAKPAAPRTRAPAPEASPAVVSPAPVASTPAKPEPARRSFAEFRPSLHGFHFTNSFSGSPLPISLGGLEKHLNLPNRYGLCGGMSFAAADYFLASMEPPTVAEPPTKGDDLYTYLYSRQVDSLGESLAAVPVFSRWMSLKDEDRFGPGFLTIAGLEPIVDRLERGEPTLLGLVLTSTAKGGMLWENHQVLAYAVEGEGEGGRPSLIRIYDPNYPRSDGAILKLTYQSVARAPAPLVTSPLGVAAQFVPVPSMRITRVVPGRRDTPVRGFFQMDYKPKTPPQP